MKIDLMNLNGKDTETDEYLNQKQNSSSEVDILDSLTRAVRRTLLRGIS